MKPITLTILGIPIKIRNKHLKSDAGQFVSKEQSIYIDPRQSKLCIPNTIIHEILHACIHLAEIKFNDQDEESLVRALTPALTEVFLSGKITKKVLLK